MGVLSKTCRWQFIKIDFHLQFHLKSLNISPKLGLNDKIRQNFGIKIFFSDASWRWLPKKSKLEQSAWSSKKIKKWEIWTKPGLDTIFDSIFSFHFWLTFELDFRIDVDSIFRFSFDLFFDSI